ncbi:MAG: hypothetical protein PHU98_14335 [Mariniphaga sp.]|nr:hypothetical protein [Mariniphaga sp.]
MTTIYVRTLKRAEHTVFCVQDGQKYYYDSQFNRRIPYSSGQQVKRSVMDKLSSVLNEQPAPTTFLFDLNSRNELKEGEVFSTCDPIYPDQLFGGWMKAAKGGNEKTVKRRSPLSVSAMRGLHPLLSGVESENISFDRSDRSNNRVIVRNEKGDVLKNEEIEAFLNGKDRSLSRKWIPDNRRAGGLFVSDIAIDLRRLFCVTLNPFEPEISAETESRLREAEWIESANVFGKCLVAPAVVRERLIPALAEAIVEWSITSNQARTFSLMETLALTISDNANKIAASIRAKLSEEQDNKAYPIIEEELDGVYTYVTLSAGGYFRTKSETFDALDRAKQKLIYLLTAFNYENQLQ